MLYGNSMTVGRSPLRLHRIHSRDIAAPAADVGALLDAIGHDGGQLWATDRWPTAPMHFDGGLDVGSRGGHGSVRYTVDAHEPGRSVVFRFDPASSLAGTHRLDVEPLESGGSRLVHTLEARIARRLWPTVPVLLGYHDAMSQDLLARANHVAAGVPLRYPRLPLWLRAVNAAEIGLWRWRGKLPPAEPARSRRRSSSGSVAGVLVPPVLLGLGVLHALWATGSAWPAASRTDLAHWVLGESASMPPDAATWTVAAMLVAAAAGVHLASRGSRSRHVAPLVWATGLALMARGAVWPPIDLANGLASDYDRIDLAVYSPLCLLLGLGTLAVARDLPARRSAAVLRHG